ncbi:MAG: O-antigen ligase family protein, partial [Spirochaetia bacterium]|nr:O-antigen ligase family protein [Spirochaetia bacterium]
MSSESKINYKIFSREIPIQILFFLFFLFPLSAAQNPDYTHPFFTEFLMFLILFLIFFIKIRNSKTDNFISLNLTKTEIKILYLLIILLILSGIRAIRSYYFTHGEAWIPCRALTSFQALECFLYPSTSNLYASLNLQLLVSAAGFGLFSFFLIRIYPDLLNKFLTGFILGGLIVSLIGFYAIFAKVTQVFPFLFANTFDHSRFTYIFSNPSWVWPYMYIPLLISIWHAFQTKKQFIFFPISVTVLLSFAMILTQQRGAFLILGVFFLITSFYFFYTKIQNKSLSFILSGAAILLLLTAAFSVYTYPELPQKTASIFGYNWERNHLVSFSSERFTIWRHGIEMILNKPLTGYGYASWTHIQGVGKSSTVFPYDTAHNLYIQLFAELGVIHSFAILFFFSMIFVSAKNIIYDLEEGILFFLLASAGFIITTLIQEIDYIRPVLYSHAAIWGIFAGYRKTTALESMFALSKNAFAGFFAASGIVILIIFFSILYFFSFNAYAFDAIIQIPDTHLSRWLKPDAVITTPNGSIKNHIYASYPLKLPHYNSAEKNTIGYRFENQNMKITIKD